MEHRGKAVFLVERGWRGARTCSLDLRDVHVVYLIKGYLPAEVRSIIEPYPHISIFSVPRPLFRVSFWGLLVLGSLFMRLRCYVSDNAKTCRQLQKWSHVRPIHAILLEETPTGYELRQGESKVGLSELSRAANMS